MLRPRNCRVVDDHYELGVAEEAAECLRRSVEGWVPCKHLCTKKGSINRLSCACFCGTIRGLASRLTRSREKGRGGGGVGVADEKHQTARRAVMLTRGGDSPRAWPGRKISCCGSR